MLLLTDGAVNEALPPNIRHVKTTSHELAERIRTKCGIPVQDDFPPYKLCDFRPLFACMFEEFIAGFDFWAWSDMDVMYSDSLQSLINSFRDYDVVGTGCCDRCSGPLCFFRNYPPLNNLYKQIDVSNFAVPESMLVDESLMTALVKEGPFLTDLSSKEIVEPFLYRNGKLCTTDGEESSKVYYHFGGGRDRETLSRSIDEIDIFADLEVTSTCALRNI